jgi:very-short-patch-repair endonuclease
MNASRSCRPGSDAPFFAKVASKSVDFAVIELTSGNVVLVVELDDRSHQQPERRERDAFVDSVLDQSGIPIRRFRPDMSIRVADVFESAPATG